MTDTSPWPDLVSTALVGTSRRAVPPTPGLPGPTGADPAAELLDRAALAVLQRRAGQRPRRISPPRPAPAETAPLLGDAALTRLEQILSGVYSAVLPEWLELAAATGRRLAPQILPALLDRARGDSALRPHLARLGGARARWLAEHNPAWSFLLDDAEDADFDPEVWKTGTPQQRRAQFAALRRTDPAAARDLLAQTWAQEKADQRQALLRCLEHGLGPDDEALLLPALHDRSRRVRLLAGALLACVPASDTGRRIAAQLAGALHVQDTRTGRRIVLRRPGDVDAELASLLGTDDADEDRAWRDRLLSLLARLPVGLWTGHLGDTPEQVVDAADSTVRKTLAKAVVHHRDPDWARALLRVTALGRDPQIPELLALLPHDERCAWALRQFERRRRELHILPLLVRAIPFQWNRPLSEALADMLLRRSSPDHHLYTYELHQVAHLRLDPALYERFAALRSDHDRSHFLELTRTLQFRHDMRKELTSP